MRLFLILILGFLFFSCREEVVQLPHISTAGVKEIRDHSPIYFFFEATEKDTLIKVNERNRIGTSHWIFHVDKRLPLRIVVPELMTLQKRRKEAQFHQNEAAENYFSYMDTSDNSLAFYPFTSIDYAFDRYHSSLYVREHREYHSHFDVYSVDVDSDGIKIDGYPVDRAELADYIKDFVDFSSKTGKPLLYLNVATSVSFETYLSIAAELASLKVLGITCSSTHFIYDKKGVELDCHCTL